MKSSNDSLYKNARILEARELPGVYQTLRKKFGPQRWWPGDTPFEVIVGAILTQNTAWKNVERAIGNLKRAKKLSPWTLYRMPASRLARLIRPAGYFNIKAKRLKNFMEFLFEEFRGDLKQMFRVPVPKLRERLLAVNGIGPETADSILLYAGEKPVFVIDAYTQRIFSRHRLQVGAVREPPLQMDYHDWQAVFERSLPQSIPLYNDFHAQIVALGKDFCRSKNPLCEICPLKKYL